MEINRLCIDIIHGFIVLDEETQQRNILAWRPVVVDVLEGYTNFPEADFNRYIHTFYPLAVELLGRDLGRDTRTALQAMLRRVGELQNLGGPVKVPRRRGSEISVRNGVANRGRKASGAMQG
jgi:brefeldin A-inhibited guanine nucleotide-exchange protein